VTLTELVSAARSGDAIAWDRLARRVQGVAWKVINGYRLPHADAEEAFAATMLRLAENLDRIRDPERVPGWVATTARNEVMSVFRVRRRAVLSDEPPVDRAGDVDVGDHDRRLVLDELQQAMWSAFSKLSEDCQRLLRVLTADPPMPYEQVAELFGMPHGSIGPTRARCLQALGRKPELRAYLRGGR
jgi:RNA polymerase sigma factor (sigma-70 family)